MRSAMFKVRNGFDDSVILQVERGPDYFDYNSAVKLLKDLQEGLESVRQTLPGNLATNGNTFLNKRNALNKVKRDCNELLHLINHTFVVDAVSRELTCNSNTGEEGIVLSRTQADDDFLDSVVCEVNNHLEDPHFGVKALSVSMGFSANYIYRRVKSLTGLTVKQFIRDYRLKVAARYLSQGEMKISEILYKVGFSSPSHFANCFKCMYNCSPSDYKQNENDRMKIGRAEMVHLANVTN